MNTVYKHIISYGFLLLITTAWTPLQAAEFCNDQYYIDTTLNNGARWDMCWEHRSREGILLHQIHYTPVNGQRRKVLHQASIAQIHVPYDDNGARYHDVSDYGLGSGYMHDLPAADCPTGQLLDFGSKSVICQQTLDQGLAYKFNNDSTQSEALSLFSVSHVGAYNYIPQWKFHDNGMIEPWMGATGALQRYGTDTDHGWLIESNRVGISHLHNFFWKLDFDLGNNGTDDFIEEINFDLVNGKRVRSMTRFNQEAARSVNPVDMRSWRVVDGVNNSNGHAQSYEILLTDSGHKDVGPSSEPFTYNDFYVTRQNSCEIYGSHNPTTNGCGRNLDEFVNGESITNQDTVVWAGVTFYHVPRAEDAPLMDAHWNHFQIIPRDWHAENPVSGGDSNTAPSLTAIANQTSVEGTSVSLQTNASDSDGDTLSYSATGLPSGLGMNSSNGLISGVATPEGIYSVTVNVTDGTDIASSSFSWSITTSNSPPTINDPGAQSGQVGISVNLPLTANDADGDTLSFSATGLPSGLNLNSSTGVISGTPDSSGDFSVTISVSDGQSSASTSFNWSISPADPVVILEAVIINPGVNETLPVPVTINGSATAATGVSQVRVGIRDQISNLWWNDGSWGTWLLAPVAVTNATATSADWSFDFDPTGSGGSGQYRVFVRAEENNGNLSPAAAISFNATAIDPGVELAVVISSPLPNTTASAPVSITGTATSPGGFSEVVIGIRDQVTNQWWNNGSWGAWILEPVTLNNTGDYSTDWSYTFDPGSSGGSGQYRMFIRARDIGGNQSPAVSQNFNVTAANGVELATVINNPTADDILDAPALINGSATAPGGVAQVLVGIRDQVNNLWWNNGSWGAWVLNPATLSNSTATSADWSVSFNPTGTGGSGEYRAFLRTEDISGARSPSTNVNFTVNDGVVSNQPPIANAGADRTVNDIDGNGVEDLTLDGSGSSDSDGTIASYEWREGSTVIGSGVSPSVSLSVGDHNLELTVTDNNGATATDLVNISVTGLNNPPSVNTIADQSDEENSPLSLQVSATDAEGDSLSYSATGLPNGLNINSSSGLISGTPSQVGSYSVTINVSDGVNSASTGFTWDITASGPIFSDDFESNLGWQTNPSNTDTATTGRFERANPEETSSGGNIMQINTTVSGSNALVTDGSAGTSVGSFDVDSGNTSIRSPLISLPAGSSYTLSLNYYFAHLNNADSSDYFRVNIITGGNSFQLLGINGEAVTRAANWSGFSVDLSSYAGNEIYLQIETADAGTPSLIEAAVDDVLIVRN